MAGVKERMQSFAKSKNLIIGVCNAERMDYLYPVLSAVQTPFVNCGIERRIGPRAIMPQANTVVVIGEGCGFTCPVPEDGVLRGELACIAVGRDYHKRLREHLQALAELPGLGHSYKIFVDSGPLNERALAVRAGLGFIGRNGFVISKKFGSMFNIGLMLTDLKLEPDYPEQPGCGDCRKCIGSCKSGALTENGFSPELCTAYLTQKKGELSDKERKTTGRWLYGCDDCQSMCPHNSGKMKICGVDEKYPKIDEILDMDAAGFKAKYSENALFWRGLEILQRNARYAANEMYTKAKTGKT